LLVALRSSRWTRFVCVAALLMACAFTSNSFSSIAPHDGAAGGVETTVSSLSVATASDVTVPTVHPLRSLFQARASILALGVLLAVAGCLSWRMLSSQPTCVPPRAAPGRRGRAFLHTYLN
jgi:hypothetical protein